MSHKMRTDGTDEQLSEKGIHLIQLRLIIIVLLNRGVKLSRRTVQTDFEWTGPNGSRN